jgi:pyruvate, water dikinase
MIAQLLRPIGLSKRVDEATYGGKAAQLAAAFRAGLPVPEGVALATDFVEATAAGEPRALRQLAEAAGSLRPPFAVRSSAVGEDSETASFAGQHVTRLNVHSADALVDAVRAIRESARSESALAYRRRLGLDLEPRIGAVVQELVLADRAGVLFTRNPLDGADDILIEASWGLGEAVVAGLVTPDRFRLSRDGSVVERTAGVKDVAVRVAADGGTEETHVAPELVRVLCLEDSHLGELRGLGLRCEEVFGGTQDLEWAFCGGTLYLLQRRAVTRGC